MNRTDRYALALAATAVAITVAAAALTAQGSTATTAMKGRTIEGAVRAQQHPSRFGAARINAGEATSRKASFQLQCPTRTT
jgi:hypothetical protein